MAKLFDLKELKENFVTPASSGILKDNFLDQHCARIESIKQLSGKLPGDGEIFFLWSLNSFNAFTFIPYIIKEQGIIHELVLSTYSISSRILNAVTHYLEKGKIEKIHILVSDSIKFRIPKVQDQLIVLVNQRPGQFSVGYGWNHSKVMCIRTKDGNFVVEGSGNFSENAQYEQYIFINNKTVYDFRRDSVLAIFAGSN